jgi:hypothetical protein
MTEAWVVPVPLLQDELFSSWLVRAAMVQGCDPLSLTGALLPGYRIWTRDPDRGLSRELLRPLVKGSRISAQEFESAMLLPALMALSHSTSGSLPIWPWMLAGGARNRKRYGGLQYCPCCLREDRRPYYRRQWRMAWHTVCAKHRVTLYDRCWRCDASLEPHRLLAQSQHVARCATCQCDLREVAPGTAIEAALALQQSADQALHQGHGIYGAQRLDTPAWFELIRYFVMLVRKTALMRTEKLVTFMEALGLKTSELHSPATGGAFELLSVCDRGLLLGNAWTVWNAGPERFLTAAIDASLTKASIHEKRQPVPASIKVLVAPLPDNPSTRKCRAPRVAGTPRSCKAVRRMYARLQRRTPRPAG